jgi:hypothetical protein
MPSLEPYGTPKQAMSSIAISAVGAKNASGRVLRGQLQVAPDTAARLQEYRSRDMRSRLVIAAVTLVLVVGSAAWIWDDMTKFSRIQQEAAAPPNWDEQQYLSKNPDVAIAVKRGRFTSGWKHYLIHGVDEGRSGVSIETLPKE